MILKSSELEWLKKECLEYIQEKIEEYNGDLTVYDKHGGVLFVTMDYIADWSMDKIVKLCDAIHIKPLENLENLPL